MRIQTPPLSRIRRPAVVRIAPVAGLVFLLLLIAPCRPSWGVPSDSTQAGPVIEARFALGPDKCPKALEVWLVSTPDTIQGFELVVHWDRPDFAKFSKAKPAAPKAKSRTNDSSKAPADADQRPVVDRSSGLIKPWEYCEARGETGLWAKITAVAYLIGDKRPHPLVPGDSGMLFSMPLDLVKSEISPVVDNDPAVVHLDRMLTRLSDAKGSLLKHLIMRDAVVRVTPCRVPAKKSQ